MRVFLTGATGFIGSHVIPELIDAGHEVVGLTRSDAGARMLEAAGAEVHRGTLEDPASIAAGAANADAVIHAAFDHDFSNVVANCEKDRRVIEAIGDVLAGSARPFIITSGVGFGSAHPGEMATEDVYNREHGNPRLTEVAGEAVADRGVSVAVVRLPQVHDPVKQGLITWSIGIAREKGLSAYIGDGSNRLSAAHISDVARLYRLALDHHTPGARWHAVDEEGVPLHEIARAIGAGLGVPVKSLTPDEAAEHFGGFAAFAAMDLPASSVLTRERLGWNPTGPGLIADLHAMDYRLTTAA